VEVGSVQESSRRRSLEAAGLLHPRPGDVTAPLFATGAFFLSADKVQVKYEMLRAHVVDRISVREAARTHGYSRAAFYLVAADFAESGMTGLLDERRGRRGPVKLSPQIVEFLQQAPPTLSGADLAGQVAEQFDVHLHRRTVERARRR
jgi:transposase